MAEVLSRQAGQEAGWSALEVRSAGTHAQEGSPASERARRAADKHGYSLDGHRSTHLTRELVAWADRIFAMSPGHLVQIHLLGGGGKAVLLGAFARGVPWDEAASDGVDLSVPDPWGGDDEVYERTFLTLQTFTGSAMKRLAEENEE